MMDETARKKRRLDREKRTLDVPRPTRRYQAFEAELTPNPRFDPSLASQSHENSLAGPSRLQGQDLLSAHGRDTSAFRKKAGKQRVAAIQQEVDELQMKDREAIELDSEAVDQGRAGEFVAYPGLRGLETQDIWNDLDNMGVSIFD